MVRRVEMRDGEEEESEKRTWGGWRGNEADNQP